MFGTQPESDPQFGERMTLVQGTVKSLVENQIGKRVQPKGKAVGPGAEKKAAPPVAVKQTGSAPASQAAANPPPKPTPADAISRPSSDSSSSSASGSKGGTPPPATGSAAAPAVSTGSQPAPSSPSGDSEPKAPTAATASASVPEPIGAAPPVTAMSIPPATTTGAQIAAATEAAENVGVPKPKIGGSSPIISPAKTSTTKTGARGMGNVPDPTYTGVGAIANQLYFSARA